MARNTNEKLDWTTLDTDSLTGKALKAWNDYQAALQASNDARSEVETTVSAIMRQKHLIPANMEPVFTYRWGKMAVAFVPEGERTGPGVSTAKLSLADPAPQKPTTARQVANRQRQGANATT